MANNWDPNKDPVAGYNPRLGVYTTKSGRSIDKFTYQQVMGQKPKPPVNNAPKNPIDMHDSRPQQSPGAAGDRPDNRPARDTSGAYDPRSPQNVKKLQQFLKSRGYSITVDGVWGPQTEGAARWFRTHHSTTDSGASKYNSKYAPQPVKPPAGAKGPVGTKTGTKDAEVTSENGDGPGPSGNTGGDSSGAVPQGYVDMLNRLMGGITSGADSAGNVNKLATAMTNSKFKPLINEMQRQVGQGTADAKAHQSAIGQWFKDLMGANAARNTADDKNLHSLLGGSEDFMQNMVKSLGGDAGTQVAKTAANNDTLLRGLGANASEFDKNMADALALTGRDTLSTVGKHDDAANADLKGQLLDLIGQRGDSLMANTDSVRNNLLSRQSQRINNYATMAMLPGQMDSQTLDGMLTTAKINNLNTKKVKPTGWAAMSATDKRNLDNDVFSTLHDGDGNLLPQYQKNPAQAVYAVANLYRQRGLKPRVNPDVNAAAKAALKSSLGTSFHNDWLPMIKK